MKNSTSSQNSICLIPQGAPSVEIETSISALNQPLADLLNHVNLPTKNILAPINERRKIIQALESTLEILPIPDRTKAFYLTKFTVAVTVGLFDGALNFLWDETIKTIRHLIASFDLQYFFNVAESISYKYRKLHTADDLEAISEHDLLEISRRIGLLTDVNYKRLEHVNYLRNHTSAAHPNNNDISGIEMLSNLDCCLKHAITAKPDHSVIQLKNLLDNIRKNKIPDDDFSIIGLDIAKQPQERIDDFALSIYGIYCDPRQENFVKINIEKLFVHIWNHTQEETKFIIGTKFGWYRKNGDISRKEATQRILEVVSGLSYKDEDSLAGELLEKLQNLRTAHFGMNNFYNEHAHAEAIEKSLPKIGIPKSIKKYFIKITSICYCGNGFGRRDGVDVNAVPFYEKFINLFELDEIRIFLNLFDDSEFVCDLPQTIADKRMRQLAKILREKTTNVHALKALDFIIAFPSDFTKVINDTTFQNILKNLSSS